MCDKKSRTKLSLEDKMAMFAYKEEHPDASFTTIANIFTEKLNKKIDRTMVFKSYHMIKPQVQEKENNQRKLISLQRKKLIKIECMLTN